MTSRQNPINRRAYSPYHLSETIACGYGIISFQAWIDEVTTILSKETQINTKFLSPNFNVYFKRAAQNISEWLKPNLE
ncbi:hypothetical protein CHS0354_003014, partial [Potamilus streckersoni]